MKKTIGIVMALLMLMSVTVAWAGGAAKDDKSNEKVPVIVGFKDDVKLADQGRMIGDNDGAIKKSYTLINAATANVPRHKIDALKKNRNVKYVEEDIRIQVIEGQTLPWGVDRIDAELVHPYNKGTGVKVAIIDTGIDYTHPDLNDNYVAGCDFANDDNDPMDGGGHGTHCAGIVAAEDNEIGVIGVAPAVELYIAKSLFDDGSAYISDIVDGIEWAVEEEVDVISMSLGIDIDFQSWHDACDAADGAGIVVVAAAGNNGNPSGSEDNVGYPARYSSVIAVAATDSNDERAWWSSTGPDVDVAAPGVGIWSTYPGGYEYMSGTSMACPHVAGTVALVIASDPDLTNAEVRERLKSTADDLGAAGSDYWYGDGLVDADEAASQPIDVHDIAVTSIVAPSPVVEGDLVSVDVSVMNKGTYEESFNVTLTDTTGAEVIGSESVALAAGESTIVTFIWNTIGATPGDYDLNAKADVVSGETDTADNSMTGTVAVVEEAPANSMHVASIDMSFKTAGPNRNAIALVTIVDEFGNPVEGATVYSHWSGATYDSDSGLTGASGEVSLKSNKVKNAPGGTIFTFTVDDVSLAGWIYDPAANGETSDSITV